jgi:aldehyde:ferredoxin oxidoreductase
MLGVCRLPWIELGLNEQHYESFYKYVTGHAASLADLLGRSSDVYDLTRLISTRLGTTRKDDSMPHKVFACPVRTGPTAGCTIKPEEFEELLDLYYRKRGWDKNGTPAAKREEVFS